MKSKPTHWLAMLATVAAPWLTGAAWADTAELTPSAIIQETSVKLASTLRVGDVVFIRIAAYPFQRVAEATRSWVNHVGIIADVSGKEPLVAESTFPLSRLTPFSRFVSRSEGGRVAIARLDQALNEERARMVLSASRERLGVHYDTGFDLHSRGQFCSRFVREVLIQATGMKVGEVETFRTLLSHNATIDLTFWRLWFFGYIPWDRETVTPASLLRSDRLRRFFDGQVAAVSPE